MKFLERFGADVSNDFAKRKAEWGQEVHEALYAPTPTESTPARLKRVRSAISREPTRTGSAIRVLAKRLGLK